MYAAFLLHLNNQYIVLLMFAFVSAATYAKPSCFPIVIDHNLMVWSVVAHRSVTDIT